MPLPTLTPTALAAAVFPRGVPGVRDELVARAGLFSSALDDEATPGDPGLFGPGSVTWRLMGQPAQPLAGLRAALLQASSAPILTATYTTGSFAEDFMGRVSRTGAFVQRQNLGSMDEVHRSARAVRAMHRRVTGTSPEGVAFDAGDPHQQAWVSMTLTDSILAVAERFGVGRLRRDEADRFVREQSTHGALLDPRVDLDAVFADPEQRAALQAGELPLPLIEEGELPTTRAQLGERMQAWTPELGTTRLTRQLIDLTVELSEVPMPQRAALRPFVLATLSTLPDEWHDIIAPGSSRLVEHAAARGVAHVFALLQLAFGPSPAVDAAHARVRRMAPASAA